MDTIKIRGARTHNLQNIDLDLPRDRLIVITGLSGSGKSSLAFDTIYAEGQRRYVESLSAYARQFLSLMEKPDVDHIEGLSPAISIEQKSTSHNPRSTVGTITEIYDYLRLLYRPRRHSPLSRARHRTERADRQPDGRSGAGAAAGQPPDAAGAGGAGAQGRASSSCWRNCAPRASSAPASTAKSSNWMRRPRWICGASTAIEVVVDRFKVRARHLGIRLAESFETALRLADGLAHRGIHGRPRSDRAGVFRQVRLPGMRLQPERTGTAAVFLQQSGRRLPELRRPGGASSSSIPNGWSPIPI